MKLVTLVAITILALFMFASCSGTGSEMTMPPTDKVKSQEGNSGPLCLGAWQVAIDKVTGTVDIYQARSANLIINVLGFLEPPAFVNLTINFGTLVIDPDNDLISVDVLFKHPIPDPVFTGFDVRGIVFGPDVLNTDGYTPFMNPDDFEGVPFGYQDGLLGAPNSVANYSDTLNGYKYFCDGLGTDEDLVEFFSDEGNLADRGVFSQGSQNWRHYDLSWVGKSNPINFFVFNYAVYANFDWPVGDPPIDLDNFPIISANSAEPFCFSASASENSLYFFEGDGGGEVTLDVEIWDWQGFDDIEVTIEASELGPSPIVHDATSAGTTSKSQIFTFTEVEGTPTSTADIKIMVTATDQSETFGSYWFLDLLPTSHQLYDDYVYSVWYTTVTVSEESPLSFSVDLDMPYTRNSTYYDTHPALITDPNGYIYMPHRLQYNSGGSVTYDYIRSLNSGLTWDEPYFGTFGTGGAFVDTGTSIDGDGHVYATCLRSGGSLIIECFGSGAQTSGIFVPDSIYGRGLTFTSNWHAVPMGDSGNLIRCKVSAQANTPQCNGWTGWNPMPYYTVAPFPSRLSRVDNIIRTSSGENYLVYFSSNSFDTWIRMSYNSDGTCTNWNNNNTVYNGSPDGYDSAREPGIFLSDEDEYYCSFILHTNTPSSTEMIAYVTSSDALDWSSTPVITYEVAGSGVIQDPTLKVFDQDGVEMLVLVYQESNEIYLTFSWDDGVTWQPPTLLSGSDNASKPDMTLTDDDFVHVVWENNSGSDIVCEYIRVSFVED